jgi:hypothetical protein
MNPVLSQDEVPKTPHDKEILMRKWDKRKQSKIHKRKTIHFEIFDGKIAGNKYISEILIFDTSGKIEEWEVYSPKNLLESVIRYTYDNQFNLIDETEFLANGHILYRTAYEYDENGFLNKQKFFYGKDKLRSIHKSTVLQDSSLIKEQKFFPPEKLKYIKKDYYPDFQSNITKSLYLEPDSSVNYSIDYEYDDQGKIVRKFFRNPAGKLVFKDIYKYNSKGTLESVIRRRADGNVDFKKEYKYNNSGFLVGFMEKDSRGSIQVYHKYSYSKYP